MSKFSFHPVGQGLFYTGSILDGYYNFVYDCGKSIDDNKFIKLIDEYTNQIHKIDLIVVSHLHSDHFNGLPYLINRCKSKKIPINKIILPYLYGSKNIAYLLLALTIYDENEKLNSEEANELFDLMCSFYQFRRENQNGIQVEFIEDNNEFSEKEFEFTGRRPIWKFHFLNKKISQDICNQLNEKIDNLLAGYLMVDFIEFINKYKKQALDEIKKIYEEVIIKTKFDKSKEKLDDLNISSIILLHYPMFKVSKVLLSDKTDIFYPYNVFLNMFKISDITLTLLTGDAKLDPQMVNYIKYYSKDRIGIMQVPHHGSKNNYRQIKKLIEDFDYYAISFGLGNQYHHPSSKAINYILNNNKRSKIYEVNQLSGLYYYIY